MERDPALNLLYGEGIHICPGAPLARLVLRLVMEELFGQTARLALSEDSEPIHAKYPAGGFDSLSVKLVVDTCCGGCA